MTLPTIPRLRPSRPAPRPRPQAVRWWSAAALALLLVPAAWAQYKVVSPDGRVTYTDRPPVDAAAKVTPIGRQGSLANILPTAGPANPLPAELQRLTDRFPVVLFTAESCAACDGGRQALRQRGIPYTERLIVSNDDVAALERTTGGRTVPSLTVGGQALRGFALSDWTSYLDAAGYPRESRLPRGWTPATPTPLVARAPTPATASSPPEVVPEAPPEPPPVADPAPGSSGIRF